MRRAKNIIRRMAVSILAAVLLVQSAGAQSGYTQIGDKLMPYVVENGDTVFLAPLTAAHVYEKKPRQKGREWRKYYRLVHNFAVTYPYALLAKDIVHEADSTIKADKLRFVSKDRYVNAIVKDLFNSYEKTLKHMTVTQGQMMMKLIDRECDILPYDIIKNFKNGYSAVFWQGIAKLFGNSLKKHYDPKGDDIALEELVQQWHDGTFEQTYYEIFWDYPPVSGLPQKYKAQGRRPSRNPES